MATQALIGMDISDLRQLLRPEQPSFRARQLYTARYRQKATNVSEVSTLPASLREKLDRQYGLGLPAVASHFDSTDGTRRYLLELQDRKTVETVLMPEEGRDTICISSQIGCPVDCKFCLTALLGLERNLSVGEIVGQVLL